MAAPMENVEIVENIPQKGRALFARRDFSEGDTLFEEKPVVSCQFAWNQFYKYKACDHCMKPLETAEENVKRLTNNANVELPHPELCEVNKERHVSCPNCQVVYCSVECRGEALLQYHKTLCLCGSVQDSTHPLNKLQEIWKNIHFPPETTNIMLICRMIAIVKQAKNPDQVISAFNKFCRATVNEEEEIAHKLLGKQFQVQIDMLRQTIGTFLYEEKVHQWFTPEGFRSLIALIGTNGQGIGTSSFSVWVKKCETLDLSEEEKENLDTHIDELYDQIDKVAGTFMDCEGSGLYTLQSTCNHSCEPNAEVTFPNNNSTLAVKATQDIKAGQEIFISYLDECARERSRHSRQKILRENYLFLCTCTRCIAQADYPDVTSEEEMEDDESDDE